MTEQNVTHLPGSGDRAAPPVPPEPGKTAMPPAEAFREFVADVIADYHKAVAAINTDRDRAVAEVKGQVQMALLIGAGRCGLAPDEAQKVIDKIQKGEGS